MRHIILLTALFSGLWASVFDINTFKANFIQTITDDKNQVLTYKGEITASKTQNALWEYNYPVKKHVYLNRNKVTIVEPEIEQVIIRYIDSSLNFFKMLQNAKKLEKDKYETSFKNTKFVITTKDEKISSISYLDEFENKVKIVFQNQKPDIELKIGTFTPKFDPNFDIIRD
jgi:outer membrane lipoprotein carrier protein